MGGAGGKAGRDGGQGLHGPSSPPLSGATPVPIRHHHKGLNHDGLNNSDPGLMLLRLRQTGMNRQKLGSLKGCSLIVKCCVLFSARRKALRKAKEMGEKTGGGKARIQLNPQFEQSK